MYQFAEDTSSVLDYVRQSMAHQMAKELLARVPIRRLPEDPYDFEQRYYTEYEMKCIVMDEQEYRELMKAKRNLTVLRGIINVK